MIHRPDLRHRLVALVDDRERVVGEIVEQRRRRLARRAAQQMTGVVLDPVAVADLADHLQVEHRPLVQPLRLERAAVPLQVRPVRLELGLDRVHRPQRRLARRDEVGLRIDGDPIVAAARPSRQRIEGDELVHLVAEQLDADAVVLVRREHFDRVAPHAESAAVEFVIVALVLDLDQLAEDGVAIDPLPALQRQQHPVVRLRRSEAVDARNAGHDHHVAALEQ